MVLEKTLESPLGCNEIKLDNPKGNQSWIFTGRTDAEAEAPILWQPDAKNWLIGKDPDAGKDWRQEEKGTTDGWMASLTQWTWVWANSRSWWWTGRPGMLQSTGSQRTGYYWTELKYTLNCLSYWFPTDSYLVSLVAQLVINLPAMQETPVLSLGWEDPMEKGYATHFSIPGLPW